MQILAPIPTVIWPPPLSVHQMQAKFTARRAVSSVTTRFLPKVDRPKSSRAPRRPVRSSRFDATARKGHLLRSGLTIVTRETRRPSVCSGFNPAICIRLHGCQHRYGTLWKRPSVWLRCWAGWGWTLPGFSGSTGEPARSCRYVRRTRTRRSCAPHPVPPF